jgi:uncharacterized protein YraI
MNSKALFLRLFGVLAILSLTLAACLPGIATLPYVTPKSELVECRTGPGTTYAPVAAIGAGKKNHILATIGDHSWWEIGDPLAGQTHCWLPSAQVNLTGDPSQVPVVANSTGLVTAISISGPAVIPTVCSNGLPNQVSFKISITTDGPASVTYHMEVYAKGKALLLIQSPDAALTFASASTQTLNPGGTFRTDCGDFIIKLIVTKPNATAAQTSWSVVGH